MWNVGREVDWVQCDGGCNEWFHMLCVGLIKSQMKPDDEFICKKCKSKKAANQNSITASSTSNKKPKSQINPHNSGPATANGNGMAGAKKRFTRSKEEVTRDKTVLTSTVSHANENSIDNSKENEPRPNNSTKNDSQSINTSRPKEKSN